MSVFRLGLVVMAAMLCLGGRAHAQAANPLTYWTPGWPVGFSGEASTSAYGNFPSFDTRDSRGFGATRSYFGNGFFIGSSRTEILGMSGIATNAAFGNFGSLYGEGSQFGYSFKGVNGMPVSISAAEGNGPVNALDVALRKDLGKYQKYIDGLKLIDYRVRILNGGTEAVTRVLIESEDETGEHWTTVGVSPNIIDASFQALMDSVTYKLVKSGAPA